MRLAAGLPRPPRRLPPIVDRRLHRWLRHRCAITARFAIVVSIGLGAIACGAEETSAPPTAALSTATPAAPPTAVSRLEPSPTPTRDPAEFPMFPVESERLADVPVPLAAELVDFSPATEGSDARAEYALADYDPDALTAWYEEHMPEFGWTLEEERDGGLVFLHDRQLSERFADEGLKRTATLLLVALTDEGDFTIVAELPEGTQPSDAASEDDAAAGDGGDATDQAGDDADDDDDAAQDDDGEAAGDGATGTEDREGAEGAPRDDDDSETEDDATP